MPKKSSILPRKPFVLLETTFPCLFVVPWTVDASNSSSLCLLLAFSLLLAKKLLSFPINVLLNLLFCLASGIYVNDIGFGIGNENIQLGFLGIPFTVFCVTGIINAFNMIDGINGLCASMVISALIGFIIITGLDVVNYAFVIAFGGIFGFLVFKVSLLRGSHCCEACSISR